MLSIILNDAIVLNAKERGLTDSLRTVILIQSSCIEEMTIVKVVRCCNHRTRTFPSFSHLHELSVSSLSCFCIRLR